MAGDLLPRVKVRLLKEKDCWIWKVLHLAAVDLADE
jgi:hypothetical protein